MCLFETADFRAVVQPRPGDASESKLAAHQALFLDEGEAQLAREIAHAGVLREEVDEDLGDALQTSRRQRAAHESFTEPLPLKVIGNDHREGC